LAIPYSFLQGGFLFSPVGIGAIAAWNAVSCMMIMRCKRMTSHDQHITYPSEISSTFAKIAYAALGWKGVYLTDFSIVFTLLGVCVSYQIAFISLFQDVSFNTLSPKQLAIASAMIVYPMTCVRDVSVLSIVSLIGLIILLLGILSIFMFGFSMYGHLSLSDSSQYNSFPHQRYIPLVPQTITDLTSFTGVSVFCFGLSSLAFPVEATMKYKHEFGKAVIWSCIFVWTTYVVVGDGLAWLYSYDKSGVKSNILQNLPIDSSIATFVRILMSVVCLLTYPLTLVPPAQMIEHVLSYDIRWSNLLSFASSQRSYDQIPQDHSQSQDLTSSSPLLLRLIVRGALVTLCACFSALVPCFAMVSDEMKSLI
jgi:solute carrier family 36 (proton-coupled amino acid transporter)